MHHAVTGHPPPTSESPVSVLISSALVRLRSQLSNEPATTSTWKGMPPEEVERAVADLEGVHFVQDPPDPSARAPIKPRGKKCTAKPPCSKMSSPCAMPAP